MVLAYTMLLLSLCDVTPDCVAPCGGGETSTFKQKKTSNHIGTIHIDTFEIRRSGIVRTPNQASTEEMAEAAAGCGATASKGRAKQSGASVHDAMAKLGVLGHGASSVVHKALHVPTLRLVAEKVIPVFDEEKRHQVCDCSFVQSTLRLPLC